MGDVVRPSEFGRPMPRDLAPPGVPTRKEMAMALREALARIDLLEAEAKSLRLLVLEVADELDPKGAA